MAEIQFKPSVRTFRESFYLPGSQSPTGCNVALRSDIAMQPQNDNGTPDPIPTVLPADRSCSPLNTLLTKWARTMLMRGSANDALRAGTDFKLPKFLIFRAICDVLEMEGRTMDAIACFRKMGYELASDAELPDERAQWEPGFQRRCMERLGKLGDVAMDSRKYNEAADHFSTMLSLGQLDRFNTLIKRSKARAMIKLWEEALADAEEAIVLDPSRYQGHEMKHEALHALGRFEEAADAFRTMSSTIKALPDKDIGSVHVRHFDASPLVQQTIHQTVSTLPRVLIDTTNGCLYDKQKQAAAFKTLPIYSELISSMTKEPDLPRIQREVKKFYQYVMLSHTRESDEPLFSDVAGTSIYDLQESITNTKLRGFSSLARHLGFHWIWTDSTCIDKSDDAVLQESLVAMFTWYRGASLTVVHLRGVLSQPQQPGDLKRSIWNTRLWTRQEYLAAETIQFYTEDWKPYLGLDLYNHKDSPAITSEMEEAASFAMFRPGLDRVREKLYLASCRKTTWVEDMAYALLGIFDASIPVMYGERHRAVGRLLEYVLTGSGDITILSWVGHTGSYHSCLPHDLTVYSSLVPPHFPHSIEDSEMDRTTMKLRLSLVDLDLPMKLYDSLRQLPSPSMTTSRLRLGGVVFPLTPLADQTKPHEYHATTAMLGDVAIRTVDDLTGMEDLCLIHPWIQPLLSEESARGAVPLDDASRALRLVARLRQPFGALLLAPSEPGSYRRVAADTLIMVRIRDETSLTELIEGVSTIEIL